MTCRQFSVKPGMRLECRDGLHKAARLNSLQLWLAARLTAIIVAAKTKKEPLRPSNIGDESL